MITFDIIIKLAMKLAPYVAMAIVIYAQNKRTIEENKVLSTVLFSVFLIIALILDYYPEKTYVWANLMSWPFVANYALNLLAKEKETINPIDIILEHAQAELDNDEMDEEEEKIVRAILKRFKLIKVGTEIKQP